MTHNFGAIEVRDNSANARYPADPLSLEAGRTHAGLVDRAVIGQLLQIKNVMRGKAPFPDSTGNWQPAAAHLIARAIQLVGISQSPSTYGSESISLSPPLCVGFGILALHRFTNRLDMLGGFAFGRVLT